MKQFQRYRRFLPVAISVVLILILVGYAPWPKVFEAIGDLSLTSILGLLGLSLLYYGLKTIRFWYMLQAIGIRQPLGIVALSYMSAQPVTLLPAGEIYRSRTLERNTGVALKKSLPQFTMQGLFEAISLALVGVVCALTLNTARLPIIILGLLSLAALVGVRLGYFKYALRLINALPFIDISKERRERFSKDNQAMLRGPWLPLLLTLSVVTEIVGGVIAYLATMGLEGHIGIFQAGLLYVIPVVAAFISFLPGGFGVSEQSAVGILLLAHNDVATAVAATLVMRITIVGGGVFFGLIAMGINRAIDRHSQ